MADQYIEDIAYIRNNVHLLNLAEIARQIDMNYESFTRAVNGKNDVKGYAVNVPKKKQIALAKVVKALRAQPAAAL